MKRKTKAVMVMVLLTSLALPFYGSTGRTTDGSGVVSQVERLGPVYPVIEPDWSTWLPQQAEKRLRERAPTLSRDRVREAIKQKMPEIDLLDVKIPRTYTVDPSVQVGRPVTDHTGKIVVPAGARVNPLERLPFFRPIIVIDGRKANQTKWAGGLEHQPLILVTSGDLFALSDRFGRQIYPVPEALIERFSIGRVPVILSARGGMIEIEEVVLR